MRHSFSNEYRGEWPQAVELDASGNEIKSDRALAAAAELAAAQARRDAAQAALARYDQNDSLAGSSEINTDDPRLTGTTGKV